jgi:O-methyltransferase involved in polyketide biosynthesis
VERSSGDAGVYDDNCCDRSQVEPVILPLSGVPRTLLMTTRARVDEHQRADGLFLDPTIAEWWSALPWDAALDSIYGPVAQFTWAVRVHLFDQIVQRHLDTYANATVVELGAGLSTRYFRVGQRCDRWIELDLPEVTELRRYFDRESDRHRFISASALDPSWLDAVPEGLPESQLIIAEGLLMYFDQAHVQALIHQLKQQFPGATFAFDAVGGVTKGNGARQLARMGAPLQWLIDTEADVAEMGLRLVEVRSLLQEKCRYPDRMGQSRSISWLKQQPLQNVGLENAGLVIEARL